jgi:hypothetical protein
MRGRSVPSPVRCLHGSWVFLDGAPIRVDLPRGPYMVFECGLCGELRVYVVSLGGSRIHCSFQAFGSASVPLDGVPDFFRFLEELAATDAPPPRVRSWCDLAA